jgi:hypothetical protein
LIPAKFLAISGYSLSYRPITDRIGFDLEVERGMQRERPAVLPSNVLLMLSASVACGASGAQVCPSFV